MRFLVVLGFCLQISFEASAQVAPKAVQPQARQPRPEEPREPRTTAPVIVPDIETQEAPVGADLVTFVLNSIVLKNATVYRPDELALFWENLIGQEVTLAQVFELAGKLTARYRGDGYILSRVVVPEQEIEGGAVRLEAVEGYVSKVSYDPAILKGRESLVSEAAARIEAERPLSASSLDRELLLIRRLAGLELRSVIRPSPDEPRSSEILLEIGHDFVEGQAGLDNRATRFYGRLESSIALAGNSWLGLYERSQVQALTSLDGGSLKILSIEETVPLTSRGLDLSLFGSYVDSNPGGPKDLEEADISGESLSFEVGLNYPVILQRSMVLESQLSLDLQNSKTKGIENVGEQSSTLANDRLRVLRAGLALEYTDPFLARNTASLQVNQGLDILNARDTGSPNASRTGGQSDFTSVKLDLSREQQIGHGWSIHALASGQYAFDPLLASETFDYGGEDIGHGYDSAELVGDHGLAGRIELRWGDAPFAPNIEAYQFYVGYDIGVVWRKRKQETVVVIDNQNITREDEGSENAASVSAGLRAVLFHGLSGSFQLAYPVNRSPSIDRSDGKKAIRAFFRLAWQF
jgi:hemolysin activation/secretion protein